MIDFSFVYEELKNKYSSTIGRTSISRKGAFTGCIDYNSCTENKYTLPERTAKARMITVQEAVSLGAGGQGNRAPLWMYLNLISAEGGTIFYRSGYWTLSVSSANGSCACFMFFGMGVYCPTGWFSTATRISARAVVEISK